VPNEIVKNYKEELHIDLSYEKLLNQLTEKYKVSFQDLIGRAKNKRISRIKEEFIKTVVKNKLMSQRELADKLKVSEQAISRVVNKV